MKILNWYSDNVIFEDDSKTIKETVSNALKSNANLSRADLIGANLSRANLSRAYLSDADLSGANLIGANLIGAYLSRAKGVLPAMSYSGLQILATQKNKLTAYKYLRSNFESPYKSGFFYELGIMKEEKDFDNDIFHLCGKGINLATLEWCIRDCGMDIDTNIFVEFEFEVCDIVALPFNSDGKFRVKKATPIRKLTKTELKKYITPIK